MSASSVSQPIQLPGGLLRDNERRLEGAELRHLSGREEEWLAANRKIPSAVAVTHLLANCLERLGDDRPTADLVRQLLVGDREYLMLQLRRLTLGERFQAIFHCPRCNAAMDVDFETADIPVERRPQASAVYTMELDAPPGTVRFRLPCGADQEAVLGLAAAEAEKLMLDRCLFGGGESLTAAQREAVIAEMERLAPRVDLELDLVCPECGHDFVAPFDTTSFFLSEMTARSGDLLREVHSLAFYYHWSESDILSLRRDRRRAYLALLSDALRQD